MMTARTNLLFPAYSEKTAAQFRARKEVPLLNNAPYHLYILACVKLVSDWLDGNVGTGAPTDDWEKRLIAEVNEQMRQKAEAAGNSQSPDLGADRDVEIERLKNELIERNVPSHLRIATSHRKWLQMSFEFCKMIGVSFSDDMEDLIRRHDLSKYTPEEVLGYAVMFGDGQTGWKELEVEEEKTEWNLTLDHHYIFNPHHPEYFYPKQENGQRCKFSIAEADPNGELYLEESVIDMMASRGERILKDDPAISVGKWMDIAEVYLKRYEENDKLLVQHLLERWTEMGKAFVSVPETADKLRNLFDRSVVL